MARFVRIASLHEIPEEGRRTVEVSGAQVTLIRRGTRVFALRNRCPHANGNLGEGEVMGDTIVCPLHRWKFDLESGATPRDRRMRATVYPVRIDRDEVLIGLTDDDPTHRMDHQ